MGDNFYKYWFNGFNKSIEQLDDEAREKIFKECGKACSDSYTKQIYINEYKSSKSFNDFLDRLKIRFPEVSFKVINENETVELTYNFCACDLVKNGYITSPLMCDCSRQSLLYNWGAVFGESNVEVKIQQTILENKENCKFLIYIKSG